MQLFLVFYKLNCCGWWPCLPGPRAEQSVLRAWCPCYVCDAQGATAYHHPASWHVPLQMWLPAVLPNWHWWDKGMEVANKDWREDVISAASCLLDPNTQADGLRTWSNCGIWSQDGGGNDDGASGVWLCVWCRGESVLVSASVRPTSGICSCFFDGRCI